MGLQWRKRVGVGKGTGINLSKTGVSASKQGKRGSIGTRGGSVRLGKGLSWRFRWK